MSIQVLQTTLLEPNGISNQKMSKACVSTNACPVYPQNTWLMSLTVQYSIMLEKKGWGGGGGSGYEGRSHDHKPVWTWDMNSLTQLRRVYESLVLVCESRGVSPSVYSTVWWVKGWGCVCRSELEYYATSRSDRCVCTDVSFCLFAQWNTTLSQCTSTSLVCVCVYSLYTRTSGHLLPDTHPTSLHVIERKLKWRPERKRQNTSETDRASAGAVCFAVSLM